MEKIYILERWTKDDYNWEIESVAASFDRAKLQDFHGENYSEMPLIEPDDASIPRDHFDINEIPFLK